MPHAAIATDCAAAAADALRSVRRWAYLRSLLAGSIGERVPGAVAGRLRAPDMRSRSTRPYAPMPSPSAKPAPRARPSTRVDDRPHLPRVHVSITELCEADGECGTTNALDNCRSTNNDGSSPASGGGGDGGRGGGSGHHRGGSSWRTRTADVYRVVDCAGGAASAHAGVKSQRGGGGVSGAIVALLVVVAFGGGIALTVLLLRLRRLRGLGGPPTMTPSMHVHHMESSAASTYQAPPPAIITTAAASMGVPLALAQQPVDGEAAASRV